MIRNLHNIVSVLAIVCLAFAGVGCVPLLQPYNPETDPDAVVLPVKICLPIDGNATKAGAGDVRASVAEVSLHDLQIWAFPHHEAGSLDGDNETAVAYLGIPSVNFAPSFGNYVLEVNMFFPPLFFSRPDEDMKLDFYILGNGSSIGFEPKEESRNLTRGALKGKTFGNDDGVGFGIETPVIGVPRVGLPQSCFFNNGNNGVDLSYVKLFSSSQLTYFRMHNNQPYVEDDDYQAQHFTEAQKAYITAHLLDDSTPKRWNWVAICPQMTLSRAVSKLRFVFAKSTAMEKSGGIVKIELRDDKGNDDDSDDTGVIPNASYVFPREVAPQSGIALPDTARYDFLTMGGTTTQPFVKDGEIKADNNPMRLCSTSDIIDPFFGMAPSAMSADVYNSFLSRWIGDKVTTEKVVYLRESDLPIQGRITYMYDGVAMQEPASFHMPASSAETNFFRNHSWTVYAYYSVLQQKLEITTSVLEWEGKKKEDIGSTATVSVDQEGKFFVDPSLLGKGQMDTFMVLKNNVLKLDRYEVRVPARNASFNHGRGRVAIYGPEGGYLVVRVNGETSADTAAFEVELEAKNGESWMKAKPVEGIAIDRTRDNGRIYVNVYRSSVPGKAVEGSKISLSFAVRMSSDPNDPEARFIDADSEIIDDPFYFVIPKSTDPPGKTHDPDCTCPICSRSNQP